MKHNKKRNTAFLFECLNRELTKSIIKKQKDKTLVLKNILKEYFQKGKILSEELDCYKSVLESSSMDLYTAEKTLVQCKAKYSTLSEAKIFEEQSKMIKTINTMVGSHLYNTFIPNYKSFATLSQIFGNKASVKKRVLMEKSLLSKMTKDSQEEEKLQPQDSLVIESFIKRFNKKYSDLQAPQRELLNKYISSFSSNGVDFKTYLLEELSRLNKEVENSLQMVEVNSDKDMVESTNQILEDISLFNVNSVTSKDMLKILKIQNLVHEYQYDDNKD